MRFADGSDYSGMWENGKQHGEGVFHGKDRSKYSGSYVHGKKEGQGVWQWPDGSYYEGEWKNDRKHGDGAVYKVVYEKKKTTWNEGMPVIPSPKMPNVG